jgi:hypothetical protein
MCGHRGPFPSQAYRTAWKQIRPDADALGYNRTRGYPEPAKGSEQGSKASRQQSRADRQGDGYYQISRTRDGMGDDVLEAMIAFTSESKEIMSAEDRGSGACE